MSRIDELLTLHPTNGRELAALLHLDDEVRVYRDHGGQWRWRRTDEGNHAKIGVSGESFDSKDNAVRAAERACPGCKITVVHPDLDPPEDPIEFDPSLLSARGSGASQ